VQKNGPILNNNKETTTQFW